MTPERYPLAWPSHRLRRRPQDRERGTFVANGKAITLAGATDKLEDQIERLGGKYPLLSTNVELRMDGRPRADRTPPSDPGACVYFTLQGRPMAMACDAFTTVQMNIAAIANHIDVVRRQARYGVATAEESLQAFLTLPRPAADPTNDWRAVLGLPGDFPGRLRTGDAVTRIRAYHRSKIEDCHPDKGGDPTAAALINAARDAALKEVTP